MFAYNYYFEEPWSRNDIYNSLNFFKGLISAEHNRWPLAIRNMHMEISTLDLKLTPGERYPEGQFDDDDKIVLELSEDFLGPIYMNMGTPGGWGNSPSPVEKIARVYI